MKLSLIAVCLISALLITESQAQFGLGFGRFGGLGFGGLGFGRFGGFGPFGFRRFGLFGGFGGFPIPVPVPVPVPAPIPVGGPFIGKRSADFEREWNETSINANRTICTYLSAKSNFTCQGAFQLDCLVEERFFDLKNVTLRHFGLSVEPELRGDKPVEKYRIVQRKSVDAWKHFEISHNNKQVPLYFYESESLKEHGFLFRDAKCWKHFEELVAKTHRDDIRLNLVIDSSRQ